MSLLQRYNGNGTKRYNRRTLYRSILYPEIPQRVTDVYIYPNETDRLDLLADKYYGDVRYWWIIAQANHLGKGSMAVNVNQRLRIPMDKESILEDYTTLNQLR